MATRRHLGQASLPRQRRSQATRAAILDAAISCLAEPGYARLTTAAVAQRAGISEGALFRHYPTKADLVVGAVEAIFERLMQQHERLLKGASDAAKAIRALWKILRSPEYLATNEVYLAARHDERLQQAIRPLARRHQDNLLARARALFGDDEAVERAADALILAMQGAAIDSVALGDRATDKARLAYFESVATTLLEAAHHDD